MVNRVLSFPAHRFNPNVAHAEQEVNNATEARVIAFFTGSVLDERYAAARDRVRVAQRLLQRVRHWEGAYAHVG